MVKHALLTAKVMAVEEFIRRVREKLPPSFSTFAKDRDLQDLVLFNLIQAIQTCVDMAAHIVSDEQMGTAGSMNEFFYRLQEKGIITIELTERLVKAVGFRNVCVHGYLDLDFSVAYQAAATGVRELEDFLAAVVRCYLSYSMQVATMPVSSALREKAAELTEKSERFMADPEDAV